MSSGVAPQIAAASLFSDLTGLMGSMEKEREENRELQDDLQFSLGEVQRLQGLLESAMRELTATQADVDGLALKLETVMDPPASLYDRVRQAEEENTALRLELQTRKQFTDALLTEASASMKEVARMKSILERAERQQMEGADEGAFHAFQSEEVTNEDDTLMRDFLYTLRLKSAVHKQETELIRVRFAKEQLERDEATITTQEKQIVELRSQLEACDIDPPSAPMIHRTRRLQRHRERTAGMHGLNHGENTGMTTLGSFGSGASYLALTAPGDSDAISFIRPESGSSFAHLFTPQTDSVQVASESFLTHNPAAQTTVSLEIPCGMLLPFTKVAGPIRMLAKQHSLNAVAASSAPIPDRNSSVSDLLTKAGFAHYLALLGEPATSAGTPTFLHVHGHRGAVARFESFVGQSLAKAIQHVKRYDGLVTYPQAFGAQQQDATTQQLITAITGTSETTARRISDQSPTIGKIPTRGTVPSTPINSIKPSRSSRVTISESPLTIQGGDASLQTP